MEDFCYAGGLPVVLRELAEAGMLNRSQMTVTGKSIGENVAGAPCWDREVIRTVSEPFMPADRGTAVLRGNLCPERGGHQAVGGVLRAHERTEAGRSCSTRRRTTTPSATTTISTSRPATSSSSATPAPRVTRACPRSPT